MTLQYRLSVALVFASMAACVVVAADPGGTPDPPTDAAIAPASSARVPSDLTRPTDSVGDVQPKASPPRLTGGWIPPNIVVCSDVTVRVVGPTGLALPDFTVRAEGDDVERLVNPDETDADGRVVLRGVPLDGSVDAVAYGSSWRRCVEDCGRATIRGPDVELRSQIGMRLHVDFVDAETGSPIPAMPPEDRIADVGPGRSGRVSTFAPFRDGCVDWDGGPGTTVVAPFAETLLAIQPLRREASIRVEITDFDGSPPAHPGIAWIHYAGRVGQDRVGWQDEGGGRLRLRGAPFFRDEAIVIACRGWEAPVDGVRVEPRTAVWRGRTPGEPSGDTWGAVMLPAHGAPPVDEQTNGGLTRKASTPVDDWPHVEGGGALRIVGRRRGWAPAPGAMILRRSPGGVDGKPWLLGSLDAAGVLTVTGLPSGPYEVVLAGTGLAASTARVDVTGGVERSVWIVEGEGGCLEVDVVDAAGRGLPFASLQVEPLLGLGWADVEGAVQRIDPFTDHLGRRTLHHVDHGPVSITATWGSRSGEVVVESTEGRRTEARIVLE